jgi:hypothetical protein
VDPKRDAIRKPDTPRNGAEQSPARSSQQLVCIATIGSPENGAFCSAAAPLDECVSRGAASRFLANPTPESWKSRSPIVIVFDLFPQTFRQLSVRETYAGPHSIF